MITIRTGGFDSVSTGRSSNVADHALLKRRGRAAAVRELPLVDERPHKNINALILRVERAGSLVCRVEENVEVRGRLVVLRGADSFDVSTHPATRNKNSYSMMDLRTQGSTFSRKSIINMSTY